MPDVILQMPYGVCGVSTEGVASNPRQCTTRSGSLWSSAIMRKVARGGTQDEANDSNLTVVYVMGKGKRKTGRLAQMPMLW